MSDLEINAGLIGRRVCNPARPEWGTGPVLRVQSTLVDGQTVHRVSVQFTTGHRTILIPPGRLSEPQDEPQRAAGWLDPGASRGRPLVEDQKREFFFVVGFAMVPHRRRVCNRLDPSR